MARAVTPSPYRHLLLAGPFAGRTWRELGYLVPGFLLVAVGFGALFGLVVLSAPVAVTLVGIPVLLVVYATTVRAARQFGALQRALLAATLGERVEPPRPVRWRPGFRGWVRCGLTDRDGWRAIAYVVVTFPLKVVGLYATLVAWAGGLVCLTYPLLWQIADPVQVDAAGREHHAGIVIGEWYAETWPRALLVAACGLVVVWLAPWVTRGIVAVDRVAVRGLLGPGSLARRVADLEESRAHAVDDSAAALRRIERDLHDGTQARLVALAMHLDLARERLDAAGAGGEDDLVRARDLVETAHRDATEAIAELREVTRSIHPPALDSGLENALTTLAARSAVPVELVILPGERPSPAIETIAYFCVAELLTNVAKHSRARHARVEVTQTEGWLRLRVSDDGVGGARMTEGGGLAGLFDRVRAIDGALVLSSPAGGPTVVGVDLPMAT